MKKLLQKQVNFEIRTLSSGTVLSILGEGDLRKKDKSSNIFNICNYNTNKKTH